MPILVQKFGGTSLATAEARAHAVRHIRRARELSFSLVVVVSAMGRRGDPYATDSLLDLIRQNGDKLPARETDLLLSCGEIISAAALCSLLTAKGIPATVLTGGQAGIITRGEHGHGWIDQINPARIQSALADRLVVIVAGFQGITIQGEVSTLGRGGSDTTAAALGVSLNAERVDIFTDVNGILTADPQIVNNAQPIPIISYTEITNLAHHGAKVVHPRAVEIAMQGKIPLRVRSTFSDEEGTLITFIEPKSGDQKPSVKDRHVTGIAHVSNLSQIQIPALPGQYDLHLRVFKAMAQHQISVDFINVNPSGVIYTVFDHEKATAIHILNQLGYEPVHLSNCSKIAIIGGGMNGIPGIMATIVEILTEQDIPILQSADSHAAIWVLVHNDHVHAAVRSLHHRFNLHIQ